MPFRRMILLLAAALAAPIAMAQIPPPAAQPAAALPTFEVISVKQNKAAQGWTDSETADGYSARGVTLQWLLMGAYEIRPIYRIGGAPAWWDSARYDIQAKVADSDIPVLQKLNYHQRAEMVQQILTDRFKLKVHRETRVQPIYSLVVARPGVLTEAPPPADGKPVGMGLRPGRGTRAGQMIATDFTMASLTAELSGSLGRMVIDNTGLAGKYHADLHWTPDNPNASGGQPESAPAQDNSLSIFTALQEQLGLKLVPAKGPVECLVIDHAEMPSEN